MTDEEMFNEAERDLDKIIKALYADVPTRAVIPEDGLKRAVRTPEFEIPEVYRCR